MRADRANVVDYIRQALEVSVLPQPTPHLATPDAERAYQALCFPHEHEIAHCAYGDLNDVVMDVGRSSSASFDRTWLPVRYYRVNFSLAQELPREADPRCMRLGGHVPDIEEVSTRPQQTVSSWPWLRLDSGTG